MRQYLIFRFGQTVLTVFVVLAIVFTVARFSGDPITLFAPSEATQADIDKIKTELGFNDPIPVQFARFLADAVRGDFGHSFRTSQPAMLEVLERVPNTLQLSVAALLIAVAVAVPAGVASAVNKGGIFDRFGKIIALVGQAMPNFWLGLLLIFFFAVKLRWLPTGGKGGWENIILPALTLGSFTMAALMRLTRSAMLNVLDSEYITMARAKGLPEWVVVLKHGLRSALIPIVTILGLQVGRLISGSVIVETIFAWPGMGRLSIQAINSSDYPVVQAAILLTSAAIVLANLGVDILYGFIDPRIRFARAR
jgi:peptide/nickel transport system permease protein